MVHAVARRFACEDLVRLRRGDEQRRYLAAQRRARIDPNPHQIDAVIFALQRIPRGGCILADEVGLGKTVEAGLTIAQLLAEGASRILLITPKPLLGQWQDELAGLFGLEVREGAGDPQALEGPGIFIVGREYAGSEAGAAALGGGGCFDLSVIDEAHEIFSGIYRRYDRDGRLRPQSRYARMAARVKRVLAGTPVLLLTATPIQNTLTEMWGLVQYVEPTGTLLGDLGTFRAVFCEGDDRRIRAGQDHELKRRLATVCQRTLRRQAQVFMARPFTQRSARLFEYSMSPDEEALYDDVTAYLMDPRTTAFAGAHRRLLLIGFHRRMGSSVAALAASLRSLAQRLRRQTSGMPPTLRVFEADLEQDPAPPFERVAGREGDVGPEGDAGPARDEALRVEGGGVAAELARVQELAERAEALEVDSKARALVQAVRFALAKSARSGAAKVVVFTESLTTQGFLVRLLADSGVVRADEVTVFRGQNAGPNVARAVRRWEAEVASRMPPAARPSRSVAVRLALVHEFATQSRVFISTEAGAKGLNLQFCDTVINYDLPWNPQRIEQRIGRCHRYGQTRDVTVINFINRDNEAQRLTLDILTRKLELFGAVLDASDAVLHEPAGPTSGAWVSALASDFEAQLGDVYENARSPGDIAAGMRELASSIGDAREDYEATRARTEGLIESRLDATVRSAFQELEETVPAGLQALDAELEAVLVGFLDAARIPHDPDRDARGVTLTVPPHPAFPAGRAGPGQTARLRIGPDGPEDAEPVHVGHRIIAAAVEASRRETVGRQRVAVAASALADDPQARAGVTGRMAVVRMEHVGFEPVVELLPVVVLHPDRPPLLGARARRWVLAAARAAAPEVAVGLDALADAVDEAQFLAAAALDEREHPRFEATLAQIERSVDDRVLALRGLHAQARANRDEAVARRDAAVGPAARTRAEAEVAAATVELDDLDHQIDQLRRRCDGEYIKWRTRAYARRYAPPSFDRILDVEFVVE